MAGGKLLHFHRQEIILLVMRVSTSYNQSIDQLLALAERNGA
jgi:hypothetical protein